MNVEGAAENCEVIKNAIDRYMQYMFPEASYEKVARKTRSFQMPFKTEVKFRKYTAFGDEKSKEKDRVLLVLGHFEF